jgi:hypothetical protein
MLTIDDQLDEKLPPTFKKELEFMNKYRWYCLIIIKTANYTTPSNLLHEIP